MAKKQFLKIRVCFVFIVCFSALALNSQATITTQLPTPKTFIKEPFFIHPQPTIDNSSHWMTESWSFFGLIDDLQVDECWTFTVRNVFILFSQRSPNLNGWYIGHIKSDSMKYSISKNDHTRFGLLAQKIICCTFIHESEVPPAIYFIPNYYVRTLTVTSVNFNDFHWSDFQNIGTGTCMVPTTGNVTAGDIITDCYGEIVIQYLPLSFSLGEFIFPE